MNIHHWRLTFTFLYTWEGDKCLWSATKIYSRETLGWLKGFDLPHPSRPTWLAGVVRSILNRHASSSTMTVFFTTATFSRTRLFLLSSKRNTSTARWATNLPLRKDRRKYSLQITWIDPFWSMTHWQYALYITRSIRLCCEILLRIASLRHLVWTFVSRL